MDKKDEIKSLPVTKMKAVVKNSINIPDWVKLHVG